MTHEPWKVLPEGTWLLQQPIQMLDLGMERFRILDAIGWKLVVEHGHAKPNSLMQRR